MLNIRKRLYRGTMVLVVVFLLAPMQDGCKFDNVQASGVHKVAALPSHTPNPSLAKGNR